MLSRVKELLSIIDSTNDDIEEIMCDPDNFKYNLELSASDLVNLRLIKSGLAFFELESIDPKGDYREIIASDNRVKIELLLRESKRVQDELLDINEEIQAYKEAEDKKLVVRTLLDVRSKIFNSLMEINRELAMLDPDGIYRYELMKEE